MSVTAPACTSPAALFDDAVVDGGVADGVMLAGAAVATGAIALFETGTLVAVVDAVGAAVATGITLAVATGTSTTVSVGAGAGATDAGVLELTVVAFGPRVGTFGSWSVVEGVPPWPADGGPALRPRFEATGAPSSMTTTSELTATAPLIALIAAVSLRRRRERLGLTGACPPEG
ncbi:MAG TPA: hypothetical protein VK773_09875 [Acidimicrobiales bacterium]|nr:hypothetical protein [Acidimicrobiales bacterium]